MVIPGYRKIVVYILNSLHLSKKYIVLTFYVSSRNTTNHERLGFFLNQLRDQAIIR